MMIKPIMNARIFWGVRTPPGNPPMYPHAFLVSSLEIRHVVELPIRQLKIKESLI